jgi:hypothetical protein
LGQEGEEERKKKMRLTTETLKRIIKEELEAVQQEGFLDRFKKKTPEEKKTEEIPHKVYVKFYKQAKDNEQLPEEVYLAALEEFKRQVTIEKRDGPGEGVVEVDGKYYYGES